MSASSTLQMLKTSSNEFSFLRKATVADVKRVLEHCAGKTPSYHEMARAQMLKYLKNQNEIGEGNEWLHADTEKWHSVEDEAYDEAGSWRAVLKNCCIIMREGW